MHRACRMALCLSDLRFIAIDLYGVGRKRRSRLPTLSKPITAADFLQGGNPRRGFGSDVGFWFGRGVVWKWWIGGACRMYRACRMALCLSDLRFIAINLYGVGRKRRSRLPTLSKPITAADFLQGGNPGGVLVRTWGCVKVVNTWGVSDAWGMSDGASLIRPTFHRDKFIWRRSEKAQPPSDIVRTDHRRRLFVRR